MKHKYHVGERVLYKDSNGAEKLAQISAVVSKQDESGTQVNYEIKDSAENLNESDVIGKVAILGSHPRKKRSVKEKKVDEPPSV